jgi:hypothetical protein
METKQTLGIEDKGKEIVIDDSNLLARELKKSLRFKKEIC